MGRPRLPSSLRVKLLLEHGDACHICGLRMRFKLGSQDPLSATYDHLIPVVNKGPYYRRSNLKLAHKHCNSSRGHDDITEDMRAKCREEVLALLKEQGF